MKSGLRYPHPNTYHLIWNRTVFPNPSVAPVESTDWYREAEYVEGGVVKRTGWAPWLGGGYGAHKEMRVLDVVTLRPGEKLDLTRTSFYAYLVADGEARRGGKDLSGWLSPEGEWHPCRYHSHDLYAAYVLNLDATERAKAGWMHLDPSGYSLHGPSTQAQEDWLRAHRAIY